MKLLLVLSCVLFAVLAEEEEKYTDKYDNINVQEILDNKRLIKSYSNCILDKGKCNAEGKELRSHIEDALTNGCKKCTEVQEKYVRVVAEHLIKHELDIWKELTAKYDPEGKFKKIYEERARAEGIVIPEY